MNAQMRRERCTMSLMSRGSSKKSERKVHLKSGTQKRVGRRVSELKIVVLGSVHKSSKDLYRATPVQRINVVRTGVPAAFVSELTSALKLPKERVYQQVGLARATIDRKVRDDAMLSPDESERVVGLAQLIGQAQTIVDESGDAEDFDAAKWVGEWLEHPHPALAGHSPGEYLDTAEGRALVSSLLAQQQSSAYA